MFVVRNKYGIVKKRLKEIRLKKGMSQESLADLIGMSQANYSRRENGLKRITDAEWGRMAKALDVIKEDIFEEDSNSVVKKEKNPFVKIQANTQHINVPDFILEHIKLLKVQNNILRENNKFLKLELERLKK